MLLLYKLRFIALMKLLFFTDGEIEDRDWFKGYHVFASKQEVVKRFVDGKALSCFYKNGERNRLYVAFSVEKRFTFHLLCITYDTSSWHIQESGVHFCKFRLENVVSTDGKRHVKVLEQQDRKSLKETIAGYALMLPYKRKNQKFRQQFTLMHADWEVLNCTGSSSKTRATIEARLYDDGYFESNNHS